MILIWSFSASITHTRDDEVSNVSTWAAKNNLHLNCSKSLEIVFRSRRIRGKSGHPAPPYAQCAQLGILSTIRSIEHHMLNRHWASSQNNNTVFSWITVSLQPTTWALYSPPVQVWCMHYVHCEVMVSQSNRWKMCFNFQATVVAKLLYYAPARSGFCSAADCTRLHLFYFVAIN